MYRAFILNDRLDCLRSLAKDINGLGGVIKFNYGDIIDSLEKLHSDHQIKSIICNEETGLQWSWERDKLVAKWCEYNRVEFTEHPSNGVIRKLRTRDDWKKHRDKRISSPLIPKPVKPRFRELSKRCNSYYGRTGPYYEATSTGQYWRNCSD